MKILKLKKEKFLKFNAVAIAIAHLVPGIYVLEEEGLIVGVGKLLKCKLLYLLYFEPHIYG